MKPEVRHGATKCTREFNVEAVKPGAWGDGGASRAGFWRAGDGVAPMGVGICHRYVRSLFGPGADEARQAELARLRRAVIKLKTERDIF